MGSRKPSFLIVEKRYRYMLRNRRRLRRLSAERLERRELLAADPFGTNQLQPLDVTHDGAVTPFDALVVINALQQSSTGTGTAPEPEMGRFVDVDGDGRSNPGDVLAIINAIAGESPILVPMLSNDSAPSLDSAFNFDLKTNDYTISLNVSISQLTDQTVHFRIGDDNASFVELTDPFVDNQLVVSQDQIDSIFGGPLPDGEHRVTIQLRDGESVLQESMFELTVDRARPTIESVFPRVTTLAGTRSIEITFGGPAESLLFDPGSIQLVRNAENGEALVPVESQIKSDDQTVEYIFSEDFPDGSFQLQIDEARLTTQAGNSVGTAIRQLDFDVLSPTAVWAQPSGGRWDDPSRWESGQVPIDGDVVQVVLNEGAVVSGLPASLHLQHLNVSGGSLLIEGGSDFSAHVIELNQSTIELSGGLLSGSVIKGTEESSGVAVTSDSELVGVVLEVPAAIEADARLIVRDGLTVHRSLSLQGTDTSAAELTLAGQQTVDGGGEISMRGTTSLASQNRIWATGGETVTFGADLSLFANYGEINLLPDSEAPINLLSRIDAAEGGSLTIGNLGSDEGILNLNLNAPVGTVRIGDLSGVVVNNSGESSITFTDNAWLIDVTLNADVDLNGDTLFVRDRLTVNGNLAMAGIPADPALLSVFGSATLEGNGAILFDDGGGTPLGNRIVSLLNPSIPAADQLVVIEGDLDIRGGLGMIAPTFSGGGGFDIRGTIASGEGGRIELSEVFSSETLTLDAEFGIVELTEIRDVVLTGTSGSRVVVDSSQSWSNVTLNLPVIVESGHRLEIADGLTLNSTLAILGSDSSVTTIGLLNDQTIDGSGSFIFAGTASSPVQNVVDASGADVTFGSGVDVLGGNGSVIASADLPLMLQGELWVTEGGQIELSNVVTSDGTLTIEPQAGQVVLAAVAPGTQINGSDGAIVYSPALVLDDATVNIPLVMTGPEMELRVENGLTLNSTIRFTRIGSGMSFYGTQTVNGEGTIEFETFDPDTTDGLSVASHSLTINETNGDTNEELTIGSEITIRAGQLTIGRGTLADNGIIRILGGFVDQNAQVTYDHNIVLYT